MILYSRCHTTTRSGPGNLVFYSSQTAAITDVYYFSSTAKAGATMSRFSHTYHLSVSFVILFFIAMSLAMTTKPVQAIATAQLTPTEIYAVSNTLLSISFTSPSLPYGSLVSYTREDSDTTETDENGNIWLIRSGRRIGTIVGSHGQHIFNLGEVSPQLPQATILDKKNGYFISSNEDAAYLSKTKVQKVGRKSVPKDSVWNSAGLQVQIQHTIYLRLSLPLQAGDQYEVTLPGQLNQPPIIFRYQPETQLSRAIHLSQLGFRPDSPIKQAFLSLWAGSLGAITFIPGTPFYLIEDSSGEKVFQGEVELKKSKSKLDEDGFGRNYNGTDVYLLNFSSFILPGTYHLLVEGVGCSPSFDISTLIWQRPLNLALRAFYHQRSGITLSPPYTTYQRPRPLHPDDGQLVMTSEARLMDTGNGFIEGLDNFSLLTQLATDKPLSNGWGGYHDAGDWDRRIQHLVVSRNLFELFFSFPEYFSNLDLNIPESSNTLPDIIDEALWSLDFFCRLQEADGSVRGGIEATGHPYFGEPSWLERHKLLAYRPGIWSTYLFAATAAKAARALSLSKPDLAGKYRDRAILAMERAEELLGEDQNQPYQINDARNLAAIELFKLTLDPLWHQVFNDTTYLNISDTPLFVYQHHDQAEAAWSYLQTSAQLTSPEIRANCKNAIIASAELLVDSQKNTGFSWLKYPWRPPVSGAFTVPFTRDVIWAWLLTDNPRYLAAVELALQFTHGANPLNLSYTTGVGTISVLHPNHPDARISQQPTPPGITVLGPLDLSLIGDAKDELIQSYGNYCYPDIRQWPALETYLDVFWYPLMTEFSIETMATQVYTFGFLAAYPTFTHFPATSSSP